MYVIETIVIQFTVTYCNNHKLLTAWMNRVSLTSSLRQDVILFSFKPLELESRHEHCHNIFELCGLFRCQKTPPGPLIHIINPFQIRQSADWWFIKSPSSLHFLNSCYTLLRKVAFHLEFLGVFEATFETDKWSTPEAKAGSVDEDPNQRTKCPGIVPWSFKY